MATKYHEELRKVMRMIWERKYNRCGCNPNNSTGEVQ